MRHRKTSQEKGSQVHSILFHLLKKTKHHSRNINVLVEKAVIPQVLIKANTTTNKGILLMFLDSLKDTTRQHRLHASVTTRFSDAC